MRDQLTNGLIVVANSAQGRKNLYDLYQIDGLLPVQDNFYDPVRQTAAAAGLTDLGSLFPTPAPPTPKP
jgi:ABC-type phosphate/phosphonate transport system substrate-binding protein